jgi:hypothetical protein
MARAPQNKTLIAALRMGAPPAFAAMVPREAKNRRDNIATDWMIH